MLRWAGWKRDRPPDGEEQGDTYAGKWIPCGRTSLLENVGAYDRRMRGLAKFPNQRCCLINCASRAKNMSAGGLDALAYIACQEAVRLGQQDQLAS
jgi:hypothetical protein